MITEEQLKENPKMAALVQKAILKEGRTNGARATQIIIDEMDHKAYNKYRIADKADRTYKDGTLFASKREMERWDYLLTIQRAGEIKDLQMQVPFELQEAFISKQYGDIGHVQYVADFTYFNISFRKEYPNRKVAEDSKGGVRTPVYLLKRKLFLHKYGEWLFFEV